jgi:hypothetical protein
MIQLEARNQLFQLGKIDEKISVELVNDIDSKYAPLHVDEFFWNNTMNNTLTIS